jgi:hypothetical protein
MKQANLLESLLKKHAVILARTGRELAMNFDIPSRDIIQMACFEMGISEKQYRSIQSYRIAKEEAAAETAWAATAAA